MPRSMPGSVRKGLHSREAASDAQRCGRCGVRSAGNTLAPAQLGRFAVFTFLNRVSSRQGVEYQHGMQQLATVRVQCCR